MARKPGPRSRKKNQKNPGVYLVLGAGALALMFMLRPGKNRSIPMAAEVPPPVAAGKGKQVQLLPPAQPVIDMKRYQDDITRERAQLARARELGLKNLPLKNQGDTVLIPLSFVPEKVWCQGGDLDTMKYAVTDDQAETFVITLEALDRGGNHPFVRTSLAQLFKGLDTTFTMPRPKEATAFGLYICSDSRNENSCRRKTMQTHEALSDELAANPKAKADDRVFFFQNLLIDGKSVEAYRTDDFSSEFQKSIKGHLAKKGLNDAAVETAWKTNATLKSAPVDIRKNRIILTLPYNDPRCLQPKGN